MGAIHSKTSPNLTRSTSRKHIFLKKGHASLWILNLHLRSKILLIVVTVNLFHCLNAPVTDGNTVAIGKRAHHHNHPIIRFIHQNGFYLV